MNPDVKTDLLKACNAALDALSPGAGDDQRRSARAAIENAMLNVALDVQATKQTEPDFDGPTYDPDLDKDRLEKQLGRVYDLMKDHLWRTLEEIHGKTGDPTASVSAQLRHLRKPRFGSYLVEKRLRGDPAGGLFEYRVLPPDGRVEHAVADIPDLKGVPNEFKQSALL